LKQICFQEAPGVLHFQKAKFLQKTLFCFLRYCSVPLPKGRYFPGTSRSTIDNLIKYGLRKHLWSNYITPNLIQKQDKMTEILSQKVLQQMASRWLAPSQSHHPLRIHTDTTDFFKIEYNDVVVLNRKP